MADAPEERLSAERTPMMPDLDELRHAADLIEAQFDVSDRAVLTALRLWAQDGASGAGHTFHGLCPWCSTGAHDKADALLAEVDALRATIEDLTAEREREAAAWSKGVGEFVDEFAPTYCAEAACGPADLLPALPEIAERIRDRVRRAAADTPKLQAAQAWVDARRERDRLLSMVRNKRTRREFFRGAEALDVAEEALAAAFTEEPEGREV